MSVRNRYASNYTKVTPFSKSSRFVSETKLTSKKLDDLIRSRYKGQKEDYYTKYARSKSRKHIDACTVSSENYVSENGSDKSASQSTKLKKFEVAVNHSKLTSKKTEDQIEKTSTSSASSDSSRQDLLADAHRKPTKTAVIAGSNGTLGTKQNVYTNPKNKIARRHSDSRYDSFPERRRQTAMPSVPIENGSGISDLSVPKEVGRRHSDSHCEIQKRVNMAGSKHPSATPIQEKPKPVADHEDDFNVFRPKSARPSSRWERRFGDQISNDDNSDDIETSYYEHNTPRPKSARPESRIMHHTGLTGESKVAKQPKPPLRPTTSRGRRKLKENKDFSDEYLGNNFVRGVNSTTQNNSLSQTTSKPETKAESDNKNNRSKSIVFDKSIHGFDPESFRQEQLKVMNAKDMLDINSGIDDIDLDIDPVVYFLQKDDDLTSRPYKPSLSKDAINIIGKASSGEDKPPIGYQGDSVNKRRHKSDAYDNFNRKDQVCLKTSTADGFDLVSYQNQHDKARQKSKKTRRPHTYAYSDNSDRNVWSYSGFHGSVSDKIISKYSTAHSTLHGDSNKTGIIHRNMYKPVTEQDDIVLRKPRKLEPINGRFFQS